jgi:hypothetical protein
MTTTSTILPAIDRVSVFAPEAEPAKHFSMMTRILPEVDGWDDIVRQSGPR